MKKVVVIGGGAAGMTAASRIKALQPSWDVKVFEKTNFVSHAPCGIPYVVEGLVEGSKDLMYYTPKFFKEKRGIDVHINSEVVEVGDGFLRVRENGREVVYDWDTLVIATGSLPRVPDIEGVHFENVLTVHHPADVDRLKNAIRDARDVVVIGAGYIGVEMCEALVAQGKRVTLIGKYDYPLPRFDEEIGKIIKNYMSSRVNLRMNELPEAIEGRDRAERVITSKGEYRADAVIIATGVKPSVEFAKQLGCKIGETGAIWTDKKMQTSVENVYAVGDCAETVHLITGKRVWVPLATYANKMGYVAGVNIAGQELEFPGILGTQYTKFFDLEIGMTGLTEKIATKEGFKVKSAFISAKTRVHYYPGGKDIWLKVVADKETNRILGAQIVGSDVAMRVNVFAAAIQAGFTTKDLFFMDIGYAPPFNPIWDPITVSARVLKF